MGFPQRSALGLFSGVAPSQLSHADLIRLAVEWLKKPRQCRVVLSERGTVGRHDALGWWSTYTPKSILVECKRTRTDFEADAKKVCRLSKEGIGDEKWFFAPVGVIDPVRLPDQWGLIEWDGIYARVVVRAFASPFARSIRAVQEERDLILQELRIYHIQGIRYRPLVLQGPEVYQQRIDDEREARVLMRLAPAEGLR